MNNPTAASPSQTTCQIITHFAKKESQKKLKKDREKWTEKNETKPDFPAIPPMNLRRNFAVVGGHLIFNVFDFPKRHNGWQNLKTRGPKVRFWTCERPWAQSSKCAQRLKTWILSAQFLAAFSSRTFRTMGPRRFWISRQSQFLTAKNRKKDSKKLEY